MPLTIDRASSVANSFADRLFAAAAGDGKLKQYTVKEAKEAAIETVHAILKFRANPSLENAGKPSAEALKCLMGPQFASELNALASALVENNAMTRHSALDALNALTQMSHFKDVDHPNEMFESLISPILAGGPKSASAPAIVVVMEFAELLENDHDRFVGKDADLKLPKRHGEEVPDADRLQAYQDLKEMLDDFIKDSNFRAKKQEYLQELKQAVIQFTEEEKSAAKPKAAPVEGLRA